MVLRGAPAVYAEIDRVLTIKYLRSTEEYVSCPNKRCSNIGFIKNDMLCCPDNFECGECGMSWRLPGQKRQTSTSNPVFKFISSIFHMVMDKLYNNNTYSDLYKVLFAQMCPSCKVMIIRAEGCKFMECGKCKFQFCWLCLSEFYTEYHYYYSLCPLRIVPIYGVVVLCTLFLILKLCFSYPLLGEYALNLFLMMVTQIYSSALTLMSIASAKQFVKARSTAVSYHESKQKRQVAYFLLGGVTLLTLLLNYVLVRMIADLPSKVFNSIPIHVGISIVSYGYHYFFPSNPAPVAQDQ